MRERTTPLTKPLLHPWLSSEDAYKAAVAAVQVPMFKLPARSMMIGRDELLSEALSILTECALPPRDEQPVICAWCSKALPEDRRKGAKYCNAKCSSSFRDKASRQRGKGFDADPAPSHPKTHIGVMWQWPEDQMRSYATREVGFRLCNYVRTGHLETPASHTLYNLALANPEGMENARDLIEAWLEEQGIHCVGDEPIYELVDAVRYAQERKIVA